MNKKYHITFLADEKDRTSTGVNVLASNPIYALIQFEKDYPNGVFLHLASEDLFYMMP